MKNNINLLFQIWKFMMITAKYLKNKVELYNALNFGTVLQLLRKNTAPSEYMQYELPMTRCLHSFFALQLQLSVTKKSEGLKVWHCKSLADFQGYL